MTLRLRHPTRLEELLNFRLLRLHAASGAPVVRLLEGRYGIARREWRLLALLARDGAMSPSALAEHAQLDRPRTSRALGSLVAKGLVGRVAEPGDRRRARVALTPAGHRLFEEVFPQVASINTRMLEALDDAAVAALDDALSRLTAQARRLNAELAQDVRADRRAGGSRRIRRPVDAQDPD
jgi:DNA-binding MarR family transcriptional regulator